MGRLIGTRPAFTYCVTAYRQTKARETSMKNQVDIFKKLPGGKMVWVRATESVDEAKVQLRRLEYINPGDYFIYDNRFGGLMPSLSPQPEIFVH
jgi:hypothetical protein